LRFLNLKMSVWACAALTAVYVASLYLCGGAGHRDHPATIKRRLLGVIGSTTAAVVVAGVGELSFDWQWFLWGGAVTLALYMPSLRRIRARQAAMNFVVDSWPTARNLVIGPVSEELVFRYGFRRILETAGFRGPVVVFVSTTLFWLAHLHHFWRTFCDANDRARACLSIIAQSAYTALFSCLAFALYFRSDSIMSAIASHLVCNALQLPGPAPVWEYAVATALAVSIYYSIQ
jgi:membrane protease YdiL (CAAX protease family)